MTQNQDLTENKKFTKQQESILSNLMKLVERIQKYHFGPDRVREIAEELREQCEGNGHGKARSEREALKFDDGLEDLAHILMIAAGYPFVVEESV